MTLQLPPAVVGTFRLGTAGQGGRGGGGVQGSLLGILPTLKPQTLNPKNPKPSASTLIPKP